MKRAVLAVCLGEPVSTKFGVTEVQVKSALNLLAPRDKRMLIELVKSGYTKSKAVVLLTSRACTLLRRNVRRDALSETIVKMSKGDEVANFQTKKRTGSRISTALAAYIFSNARMRTELARLRIARRARSTASTCQSPHSTHTSTSKLGSRSFARKKRS